MSLSLQWLGKESADEVGRARAFCYSPAAKDAETYQRNLAADGRVADDGLLLARRDGEAVGTLTAYPMRMWARGHAFDCQGVAWVGTIKSARRSGGVASQLMREAVRRAREHGQVLSALMPFRASYYEHFGYGVVERRATWTIPLSILPTGPTDGFEFVTGVADEARRACRQRAVEAGQCDFERAASFWDLWLPQEAEGFTVADRAADGSVRSWFNWSQEKRAGKDVLIVQDQAWDSPESLKRALAFFATLKDQYWAVALTVPADLQLNRWLKETQVPHRLVNHDTAEVKAFTRMQVRVLDHARLIEGLNVPADVRGAVTVAIRETEGTTSTLRIEFEGGRATAKATTAAPDVECADQDWAAVVLGDLPATRAAELALIKSASPATLKLLDAFAAGPAPFSNEYF
jgi:predicted acetyltransferase